MADSERQDPGDAGLVFAAHNNHDPRCSRPPRVRNTDNPELYHGYFENRFGEQFVFTFDRATGTGTVSGGDLGWDDPKSFTLGQLEDVALDTLRVAAQVVGQGGIQTEGVPVIDAAPSLGRITGLTGKGEIVWLRACLAACTVLAQQPGDCRSS